MSRILAAAAALLVGLAALPAPVRAAEAGEPICADRPAKGTAACTVDRGRWQVEMDGADWTHGGADAQVQDLLQIANTTLKYGISDRLDLELNLAPFVAQQAQAGGRARGFGDLMLKAKLGLARGDRALSVLPFLKLPTAGAGLGDGAVEGGLVLPVSFALPQGFSLTLDPEADLLKNAQGQGRQAAYAMAAGLGHGLGAGLGGTAEVWASDEQDPQGRRRQASFDLGLAWIAPRDVALQLDGGVNLGLSRDTPGLQLYVGVSRRF